MDDDTFKSLREESLLDAAIIAQMDLAPENFAAVSSVLQVLNWLKAVAKEEGVPLEHIDRKFVVKRILNRELSDKEIERAVRSLTERNQRGRK